MIIQDHRTKEEKITHNYAVLATDTFMSGWGKAEGGNSYIAFATLPEDLIIVEIRIRNRIEMKRIRLIDLNTYKPNSKYCSHFSIVVVDK